MMGKKKIAFVIESLNLGGGETGLLAFLNNMDIEDYDIDLILFKKNSFFEKFVSPNVNIVFLDFPNLNIFERILFKIKRVFNNRKFHTAQLLWDIIKNSFQVYKKEYDVIHAFNQGFVTYFVSRYMRGEKKYAWINIDYQKVDYNIKFDFDYYRKFDRVITISDEVDRGFREELKKINKDLKTEIIKLFVDLDLLKSRGDEDFMPHFGTNKIKVVTVCRLTKQKGLDLAIQACKILKERGYDIEWFIVGEGVERNFLEGLIREKRLTQEIQLIGIRENPYPFIKNADIYVQTSIFEGLGLTVLEATLLNKPIVCTNFPTSLEIIENYETGLIVEMNPICIADGISKLILDDNLRSKLIQNLEKKVYLDKEQSLEMIDKLA